MKFNQKHTLMALITVTLIASGCTGGGGGGEGEDASGTNPIQATSFTAAPNPAPNGNSVTFTLELTNTGDKDAENVVGKLYNPPFADSNTDSRTWRDSDEEKVEVHDRSFGFGSLQGQQEGVETFAEPQTLSLTAPTLNDGQSFDYNFKADYTYKYSTDGDTTITVMDSERYRETGGTGSKKVDISHNSAPISLEGQLLSGNPIVFYDDDDAQKTPQFCVVIDNVGGGTVFSNPTHEDVYHENGDNAPRYTYDLENKDFKNHVTLSVESVGGTDVKDPDGGSYDSSAQDKVELIGGDQARKCFKLQVDELSASGGQKEIGPINVNAEYGYSENTGTSVKVNSR